MQLTRISKFNLSVFALGFSAFSMAIVPGSPAFGADDQDRVQNVALKDAPHAASEDVKSQVINLRNMFEEAGRSGLVDWKDKDASDADTAVTKLKPRESVANCMTLSPLFDGGQGDFATGLFTESRIDWPENAVLAETLADLIDPGYDGRKLPLDLSQASECGPSFIPWQALADPATVLDAKDETILTGALAKIEPNLRRNLGVQIAIRAGLAGNMRLTRRISDTLIDAQLHGQSHHDRDPEHILLEAIMTKSSDPVGARARLSWIAERDGPEQMVALDLMREIDAAPAAQSELQRLSESPDQRIRLSAERRLLSAAIDDADIEYVAELVTATNNLADDADARARLAVRLEEAIDASDPLKAIQALDVIGRLDAKGVEFSPSLKAKADARLKALTSSGPSAKAIDFTSSLPKTNVPEHLSGPELTDYFGTLNNDLSAYQEVLNRG